MRLSTRSACAILTFLAVAGCGQPAPDDESAAVNADAGLANADMAAPGAAPTTAEFKTGDGTAAGTLSVSEGPEGLTMTINASGMPAGVHGLHLHAVGKCEGPKFESAGDHWNPTAKKHGRDNPAGAHLGDLDNLTIAADGTGTATLTVAGAGLRGGANPLLDADGAALLVHADPDDYRTDPSGNSGDRIACAVIGG